MRLFFCLFLSLSFLFQGTSEAWWGKGHQVVAQIAYDQLTLEAKEEVDRLAATFSKEYPEHASFVALSTWLDDIKGEARGLWGNYHFTDGVYDPDRVLSEHRRELIRARSDGNDIIAALVQAERVLGSRASDQIRSLMLALAIHCVADIHQPLHCTSRYSSDFPCGDRGGNLVKVQSTETPNLHQLWDSGFGLLAKEQELQEIRTEVNAAVVCEWFPSRDPKEWARESRDLAEKLAYDVIDAKGKIQEEATEEARRVVAERLLLAGRRLADYLNRTMHKAQLYQKSA